jgi:3',5'-cyclic-AMP phosphodiesterase
MRPLLFSFIYILTGCSLFEYHPYEVIVPDDEQDLNAKAIQAIQATIPQKDTMTLILMGDTQRFYDDVDDFVTSANTYAADFVVLNGDITDFGINDEFHWVHSIMKKLNKPYLAVIGNHDVSGNGELVFEKMYGSLNYSFIKNGFKFIFLNTNSREYRFNGHVPDTTWLKDQLTGDDFSHGVVSSHVPPFDNDFDPALENAYARILRHSNKVNVSLHGHLHSYSNSQPYDDGIQYIVSTSMDQRMYLILKLWDDKFSVKEVYY